jgi:Ca2+-binding EF-hand superfamily protein
MSNRKLESSQIFPNLEHFLEYVKACRQNGNASPESTLREAFKLFDLDNDGSIDFNEFASAMKFLGSVK